MLENKRLVRNLKVVAALGVLARQGRGLSDDEIRKQLVAGAVKHIRENVEEGDDETSYCLIGEEDIETAVCVVQREVDRLLEDGPTRRIPHGRPAHHWRRFGQGPSLPSKFRPLFPRHARR